MNVPKEIVEKLFDGVWWDKQKIWKLEIPVTSIPLEHLTWQLDLPIWWSRKDGIGKYDVKPIDVMRYPEQFPEEFTRTTNAELIYPVDVVMKNGRYVILDGLHRVLKSAMLGLEIVDIRIITKEYFHQVVKEGKEIPEFEIEG